MRTRAEISGGASFGVRQQKARHRIEVVRGRGADMGHDASFPAALSALVEISIDGFGERVGNAVDRLQIRERLRPIFFA